jgi:hypothetical protein
MESGVRVYMVWIPDIPVLEDACHMLVSELVLGSVPWVK